jgi:hypothetical protein
MAAQAGTPTHRSTFRIVETFIACLISWRRIGAAFNIAFLGA